MLKFVLIFIVTAALLVSMPAQTIKIKAGGSLDLQTKSTSDHNQQLEDVSFGSFYDNAIGLQIDACISLHSDEEMQSSGNVFAGINFEKSSISTENVSIRYIMGESISQTKFTPYVGYGIYFNNDKHKNFLYGYAGLSIRQYEGKSEMPVEVEYSVSSMDMKYSFRDIVAFRLGAGLDFENLGNSPFFISFGAAYDWGSASRGIATGSFRGQQITLQPEGQIKIDDNIFYISIALGYELNL